MAVTVGVRFRTAGRILDFDPAGFALQCGDAVVVSTARGLEYGHVARQAAEAGTDEAPLREVVRLADYADEEQFALMQDRADEALKVVGAAIARMRLAMHLVDAEFTLDGRHLTCRFMAEDRVDFRELLRELQATFGCRVELRQIGARDKAKIVGGFGMCGREMCCSSFLTEFQPVSIRMAKEQGISLNPLRITGNCGRLRCCLRFEYYGTKPEAAVAGE